MANKGQKVPREIPAGGMKYFYDAWNAGVVSKDKKKSTTKSSNKATGKTGNSRGGSKK